MSFCQVSEDGIVNGFHGADHKKAATIPHHSQVLGMSQEVLDLDCNVEGKLRKFPVHGFNNGKRMGGSVEEIRIAKTDMLGAGLNLFANVFEYNLPLHNPEDAVVNGNNGAMAAQVFAPAAGFRVAGNFESSVWHQEVGVLAERRKIGAIWRDEAEALEGDRRSMRGTRVGSAI